MIPKILVEKVHPDAKIPVRSNHTDSGLDVFVHDFKKLYALGEVDAPIIEDLSDINQESKVDELCFTEFEGSDEIILFPLCRALLGTGIKATVGEGYEIQVRPRSGLALKEGLICNFGTIDEQYTGEIGIILFNLGNVPRIIKKGDKIAQIVVAPVTLSEVEIVDKLNDTNRGEGGFGSTGKV